MNRKPLPLPLAKLILAVLKDDLIEDSEAYSKSYNLWQNGDLLEKEGADEFVVLADGYEVTLEYQDDEFVEEHGEYWSLYSGETNTQILVYDRNEMTDFMQNYVEEG